jgi:N-(2-amino-2-carboxyethyl)-L-glutamate synthase
MNDRRQLLRRSAAVERIIRETPIIHLAYDAALAIELYAKMEFFNGVGSIKDRPAWWILKRAIERGEVGPDTTVIESSSGNFACALSVFCSMLDLRFIPVIDPNISPFYEKALACTCDRVVKVDERDDTGGFLKTRLRKVQELLTVTPDSYWPNQYENTDGMAAHYHLTGAEIEPLQPDYVFAGVSTGGTIAGVSRRLKEKNPAVRIIAVDVEGSIIFGGQAKKRRLPGLGSSVRPALLRHAQIDDVVMVTESNAVAGCRDLLTRHGLFVGASTGCVYSAIKAYFSDRRPLGRPRVVFLCCDRGSAYLHNVFDPAWTIGRQIADGEHHDLAQINA